MAKATKKDVARLRKALKNVKEGKAPVLVRPEVNQHMDAMLGSIIGPNATKKPNKKAKKEFLYCNLTGAWGERKYPGHPEWNNHGGFVFSWGVKDFGFGELTFRLKGGKKNKQTGELEGATVECDSEGLSREFVRQALAKFAESVKIR